MRFRHWNNIAIGSCLPATPRLRRTIFVTNNQVLWGKSFTIGLLSICLVISILWHRKRVGPTTTADKKSNNYRLELLFNSRKGQVKTFYDNVRFPEKPCKMIRRIQAMKQILVLLCNEANIKCTSAIKQIFYVRVQWSKYYIYECNEAHIICTSAMKQIVY